VAPRVRVERSRLQRRKISTGSATDFFNRIGPKQTGLRWHSMNLRLRNGGASLQEIEVAALSQRRGGRVPLAALAEQPGVPIVGFLHPATFNTMAHLSAGGRKSIRSDSAPCASATKATAEGGRRVARHQLTPCPGIAEAMLDYRRRHAR
jgi:hypothetical protein